MIDLRALLVFAALLGTSGCATYAITRAAQAPPPPQSPPTIAPEPPAPRIDVPDCIAQRSTEDRPDDSGLPQIRVMYVLPRDGVDEQLDATGKICRSIRSLARWFQGQTGGPSLRFDTWQGMLDVGFVRLEQTDRQITGRQGGEGMVDGPTYIHHRIQEGLPDVREHKIYAVFYGGGTAWQCGSAPIPSSKPGRVAGVYLKGHPAGQHACEAFDWGNPDDPDYIEFLMAHEIVHALGFVAAAAPHHVGDEAHVFDRSTEAARDLMYRTRRDDDPTWATAHPEELILDVGRDDYYGHGREDVPDLANSPYVQR